MRHLLSMLLIPIGRARLWCWLTTAAFTWLVATPSAAAAQTRSFNICFTEGVRSCTFLELTTTAFYNDGTRIGTGIEVLVSHDEGTAPEAATVSALSGFFFSYAGSTVAPMAAIDLADELGMLAPLFYTEFPTPAPDPLSADGWRHTARSSTSPTASPLFDNYLALTNFLGEYNPETGLVNTQMIGGCGAAAAGGVLDIAYSTEVWTCGGGQYRFSTFTEAWFDVDLINTVGVTTYARFDGAETGVAAWCNRSLDENISVGDATGSFEFGNVCAVDDDGPGGPGGGPGGGDPGNGGETPVSEPTSVMLVLFGLGALLLRRRQHVTR